MGLRPSMATPTRFVQRHRFTRCINQLPAKEIWPWNPAELARVSPLAHRHINFLGRYAFTLPEAVARGGLRPLRDPNSE